MLTTKFVRFVQFVFVNHSRCTVSVFTLHSQQIGCAHPYRFGVHTQEIQSAPLES